mgnify:CR=1 FL=1
MPVSLSTRPSTPRAISHGSYYWALGLVTGFSSTPSPGPYEPHFSDSSNRVFSVGEEIILCFMALVMSAVWACVTGKIVDLIANADPDRSAFWQLMDDLNRFTAYYNIPDKTAVDLREYFHEKRELFRMQARAHPEFTTP